MARRGQKGKYAYWITEPGLLTIEGWAREGLLDKDIIAKIGVSTGTFYEWLVRFPEIREALKKGKAPVDVQVENALLKRALGYEYDEKTIEKNDMGEEKTKIVRRYMAPDVTAQIFWLKNRRPDRWRDKQVLDMTDEGKLDALVKGLKNEKKRR